MARIELQPPTEIRVGRAPAAVEEIPGLGHRPMDHVVKRQGVEQFDDVVHLPGRQGKALQQPAAGEIHDAGTRGKDDVVCGQVATRRGCLQLFQQSAEGIIGSTGGESDEHPQLPQAGQRGQILRRNLPAVVEQRTVEVGDEQPLLLPPDFPLLPVRCQANSSLVTSLPRTLFLPPSLPDSRQFVIKSEKSRAGCAGPAAGPRPPTPPCAR